MGNLSTSGIKNSPLTQHEFEVSVLKIACPALHFSPLQIREYIYMCVFVV